MVKRMWFCQLPLMSRRTLHEAAAVVTVVVVVVVREGVRTGKICKKKRRIRTGKQ